MRFQRPSRSGFAVFRPPVFKQNRRGRPIVAAELFQIRYVFGAGGDLPDGLVDLGLVFAEAMWMRTNPVVRRAKEIATSGALGDVTQVRADVTRSLGEAEAKIVGIPAMASGALGKLGASFASMN